MLDKKLHEDVCNLFKYFESKNMSKVDAMMCLHVATAILISASGDHKKGTTLATESLSELVEIFSQQGVLADSILDKYKGTMQ